MQDLSAPQLSGLLGAMVAAEVVARPHISAAYEPSSAIVEAVEALEPARSHLFNLQAEAGVDFPLMVDLRPAGDPIGSVRFCWGLSFGLINGGLKSGEGFHLGGGKSSVLAAPPPPLGRGVPFCSVRCPRLLLHQGLSVPL